MIRSAWLPVLGLAWACSSSSTNTDGASTGGASTGGASTGGASTGGASTGGASTGGASTGGAPSGGGAPAGGGMGGAAGSGGTGQTLCDVPNCTSRADCCAGVHPQGALAYRELVKGQCQDPYWCLSCAQGGSACNPICQLVASAKLYDCIDCMAMGCATSLQSLDTTCAQNASCKEYRECLLPCP